MVRTFEERDGKPFALENGPVNLGIAVDVEKKDGSHTPDGAGDQGLRRARLRRLPLQLRRADREDAREQAHRRRLPGHQHLPHQPGRGRHRRLGAAPAQRPERDHRHRLDRLPAGVAARLAGTAEAARRLEGDDDDLDLRPPGDPGGRVGRLPEAGRAAAAGRGRVLRAGRRRPRDRRHRGHQRPPRLGLGAAAGRRRARDRRRPQRRTEHRPRRSRRRAAAGGPGGDLGAEGLPHPRPPRRPARSARLRAQRRPGPAAGERQPDPGADGPDPGLDPAHRRPRRNAAGGAAADARDLLRHDRLPVRAPLLAPAADLAARDDRDRRPPPAAHRRGETAPARAPDRRLPVRALPREGLPGPEDVLDRGARRGRADARRAGHTLPPRRRRGGRLRDGPPRPPQRPRPQPRPPGRVDPGRVRGLEADRRGQGAGRDPPRRHRRRQVPLRPPRPLRDGRGREDLGPALPEPEPPRVRRPGRHRRRPLPAVRLRGPGADPRPQARGAGAAARRRRLPGPGGRRRDAQPAGAEGLQHRRHDPRHPEQPGRLHHRSRGGPLDPLRGRHGEGLQRADRPRQRRRRRGLLGRGAAGDGLPRALGPRHRHRRDRLPPLRPQRDRRARLHAADDGGEDQVPPAGLRDLRREADRRGDDLRRGSRPRLRAAPRGDVDGAEAAAREDGGGRVRGPDDDHQHRRNGPHREPAGRHRGPVREAARAQPGAAEDARRLQRPPQAAPPALEAARGDRRGRHRLRPGRGARLQLAADRRRPHPPHRAGHRARHLLPPPPRPPRREHRPQVHADAEPRGRLGAVRALQQPALGDRLPRLRVRLLGGQPELRWSSGRRSSATSPTPPR